SEWSAPVPPQAASEQPGDESTEKTVKIPMPPRTAPPASSAYGKATMSPQDSGQFQLVVPQLGTIVSGQAVGSMIAGIATILVAVGLGCIGLFGLTLVAVAVFVLTVFCAAAAGALGGTALRQIRRSAGEYRGRGMAITGLICGGVGVLLALPIFLVALVLAR
ncbi:MAG: hypothetical protein ACRDXX_22345, partial [Stackebrandtia sp.]